MLTLQDILNKKEKKEYDIELDLIRDLIEYYSTRYKSTIETIIVNFNKNNTKVDALTNMFLKDLYEFLTVRFKIMPVNERNNGLQYSMFNPGKYNFYTGNETPDTKFDIDVMSKSYVKPLVTEKTEEFLYLVNVLDIDTLLLTFVLLDKIYSKYVNS